MNRDEFEILYMYKIYECECDNSNFNSMKFLSLFDQLSEFLIEYTNLFNTKPENEFRSIIDGILDYFNVGEYEAKKTLSNDLALVLDIFLILFDKSSKQNCSIREFLSSNRDLETEIKAVLEKYHFKTNSKSKELER